MDYCRDCETNEEDKKEINIFIIIMYTYLFKNVSHTNIKFNVIFFIYDTSLF